MDKFGRHGGRLLSVSLLLVLTMCVFVTATITPIPEGVSVRSKGDMYVVASEWTLLVALDPPSPLTELRKQVSSLQGILRHEATTSDVTSWSVRLRIMDRSLETMDNKMAARTARVRRGLMDFGGAVLRELFGVATEQEVKQYHDLLEITRKDQTRIVHRQSELISVLNQTLDVSASNRKALRDTQQSLKQLAGQLNISHHQLLLAADIMEDTSKRIDIEVIVSKLETVLNLYQRHYDLYSHRKAAMEAGRLTESLLPVKGLMEVLSQGVSDDARIIQPIQWYYEFCRVIPVWGPTQLVYKVTLPLIKPRPWLLYEVTAWPTPVNETELRVQLDVGTNELYAIHPESNDITQPHDINGHAPAVGYSGVIWQTQAYKCVRALLGHGNKDDCTVSFSRPGKTVVHTVDKGQYVISTSTTSYVKRCYKHPGQVNKLKRGVYWVKMENGCTMLLNDIVLSALPMYEMSTAVSTDIVVDIGDINI